MEGVGARFGRSSTRYGPTSTVFSGPVRKWHKKWVHVAPPNTTTNTPSSNHHKHTNGSSNLLFYKWAPIANGNRNGNGSENDHTESKDDDDDVVQEPPRRKFRYVPVAVLEEQQNETAEKEAKEKVKDEAKSSDAIPDVGQTPKSDGLDEKPDINDVPMEENQDADDAPASRQDRNVNLGFNLNSNDGDPESDTNADEN